MNICLFTEQEINSPLSLKDERANHLIKILHKKEGDTFTAGIVNGPAGKALITKIDNESISFTFTAEGYARPLSSLIMIVGFPRPIQLKRLLRDVAGIGIKEIHLTGTELGEKSYMQSTLVEKGNAYKMLLDGTVQAGSTFVPGLFLHQNLKDCIEAVNSENKTEESYLKLMLDNVKPQGSLSKVMENRGVELNTKTPVVAAIGSERGWTDKERALLTANGFAACSMGKRILRTESAATVAGSIILDRLGFLD